MKGTSTVKLSPIIDFGLDRASALDVGGWGFYTDRNLDLVLFRSGEDKRQTNLTRQAILLDSSPSNGLTPAERTDNDHDNLLALGGWGFYTDGYAYLGGKLDLYLFREKDRMLARLTADAAANEDPGVALDPAVGGPEFNKDGAMRIGGWGVYVNENSDLFLFRADDDERAVNLTGNAQPVRASTDRQGALMVDPA